MEDGTANRVYRFRMNAWWQAMLISMVAGPVALIIIWVCRVLGLLHDPQPSPWDHIFLAVAPPLFGVDLVLGTCLLIRENLKPRRVRLVADDCGLSVTDWRARETHVPWDAIQELRIETLTGLGIPARARIVAGPNRFLIDPWVENRHDLLDEIISRAHLTSKSIGWYQTRYFRPASAP